MAKREELILDVEVKGAKDVDKLADLLEDVEDNSENARNALKAMATVMDAELRGAAAAADALAQALGPELTAKMDLDQVVLDLNKMGVGFDEVRADADKFALTLKEIDDIKLSQVNDGLDRMRGKMDHVRSSSDQSRSVLANLAGNAAQDLGQLGGVVGSLGVGIGQLAEYAVDGNIAMSNLAKVAGPMLGLSAALFAVQYKMAAIAKEKAFDKGEVDAYADAVNEVGIGADAVAAHLNEIQKFEFAADTGFGGFGTAIKDVTGLLENFGITADEISRVIAGTDEQQEAWRQSLLASGGSLEEQLQIINAVRQATENYRSAVKRTADVEEVFAGTIGTANKALTSVLDQLDPMRSFGEQWAQIMSDIADGHVDMEATVQAISDIGRGLGLEEEAILSIAKTNLDEKAAEDAEALEAESEALREATTAAQEFAAAVSTAEGELNSATGRAEAFASATERFESIHPPEITAAVEVQSAIDDLDAVVDAYQQWVDAVGETDFGDVDVVPDSWEEIQNLPDDLPPVLDALAAFRESMQSEMAQAFEREGPQGLRDWAKKMETGVREALSNVEGITEEQVTAILHSLGLLPPDISTTIRISQAEQVLGVIDDVVSGLGDIPPQVSANIAMAVNNGDPDEALRILNEHLRSIGDEPVTITVNAETGEFEIQTTDAVEAVATGPGATIPVGTETDTTEAADALLEETSRTRLADIVARALTRRAGEELDDVAAEERRAVILAEAATLVADNELDNVAAAERRAVILAEAATLVANSELDAVAADRIADIFAMPHAHEYVESLLNNIARDRTADIYVVTHNTSTGGGGGGGGATPQAVGTLAAPGIGTLAAVTPMAGPTTTSISAVTQVPFTAPAAAPINVTINAGVLGNHFDVERTVARALRRHQRVNGRR